MAARNKRLVFIDSLRGTGALMVLFYHIAHHPADTSRLNLFYLITLPLDFGYLGVPLFLVVSGFCIHLTAAGAHASEHGHEFSWRSFWKRRFHRLYPPYLLTVFYSILISYWCLYLAPGAAPPPLAGYSRTADLALHILLIHNLFTAFVFAAGNPALWSLGLEEQLYALYAVYLWLRRRLAVAAVASIAGLVMLAWIFAVLRRGVLYPDLKSFWAWQTWPIAYWFYWVLGAIAAENYKKRIQLPEWCYSLLLSVSLMIVGVLINPATLGRISKGHFVMSLDPSGTLGSSLKVLTLCSEPLFAMAFFLIVNHGVRKEVLSGITSRTVAGLGLVGVMSYSLYLTHQPLTVLFELLCRWQLTPGMVAVRYLLFTPVTLLFAAAFYFAVERHFLNTQHKRYDRRLVDSVEGRA